MRQGNLYDIEPEGPGSTLARPRYNIRPVHFEIPATNPEAVATFYTDRFGWKISSWSTPEMGYWIVDTGKEGPGINGGILRRHRHRRLVLLRQGSRRQPLRHDAKRPRRKLATARFRAATVRERTPSVPPWDSITV